MGYLYHRILFRNKKEQTIDTYNRIDGPQKHNAEQKRKTQKNIYFIIVIYTKY